MDERPGMQGGIFLLTTSAMLLATTVMVPWWIVVEGFTKDESRATLQFAYHSWEGRVTIAAVAWVLILTATVVADPTPAKRTGRCVLLLAFALLASIAPSVYLWRETMARGGRLLTVSNDVFDSIGPGLVLSLLALVGIGFGASMTYKRERIRGRARAAPADPAKNLDAPEPPP